MREKMGHRMALLPSPHGYMARLEQVHDGRKIVLGSFVGYYFRPEPLDEFVHFHSCYNGTGSVLTGYWIRHVAVSEFTYDMGKRVGKESPLYHQVCKGPDRDFARILEFDRGQVEKDD